MPKMPGMLAKMRTEECLLDHEVWILMMGLARPVTVE